MSASGRRRVLVPLDQRCSVEGCEKLAEGSLTLVALDGSLQVFGCADHIEELRWAQAEVVRRLGPGS